jgi:hypothetical protein
MLWSQRPAGARASERCSPCSRSTRTRRCPATNSSTACGAIIRPATAANSVHTYVARLRRVLEPERIRRAAGQVLTGHGSGYLGVDPGAGALAVGKRAAGWREPVQAEGPVRVLEPGLVVVAVDEERSLAPVGGAVHILHRVEQLPLVRCGAVPPEATNVPQSLMLAYRIVAWAIPAAVKFTYAIRFVPPRPRPTSTVPVSARARRPGRGPTGRCRPATSPRRPPSTPPVPHPRAPAPRGRGGRTRRSVTAISLMVISVNDRPMISKMLALAKLAGAAGGGSGDEGGATADRPASVHCGPPDQGWPGVRRSGMAPSRSATARQR